MVEQNLKKLKARKRRVMNGFNTGTRDMKLKTAYRRKKDGRQKMPTIRFVVQKSLFNHANHINVIRIQPPTTYIRKRNKN